MKYRFKSCCLQFCSVILSSEQGCWAPWTWLPGWEQLAGTSGHLVSPMLNLWISQQDLQCTASGPWRLPPSLPDTCYWWADPSLLCLSTCSLPANLVLASRTIRTRLHFPEGTPPSYSRGLCIAESDSGRPERPMVPPRSPTGPAGALV